MEVLFLGIFVVIGLFAVLFLYSAFSWGLVMFKFWNWFILPVFVGLPAITFIQAVGLMFFMTLFKNHDMPRIKKELLSNDGTTMSLITPWIVLFLGWLANIFIL
jgi:hypothetical protein